MNTRLKKALTVVGATAALALVVSACASSAGKVMASSIDCSQPVKDRIAVVNAASAKVNADQKAVTEKSGRPDGQSAKAALKADTQTRDALDKQNKACASPSKSPSPSASPTACASSWVMTTSTPKNGKWVAEGVTSIQTAQTSDQAKAAAEDWLDKIKTVPGTLAGAAAYVLNKQVDSSTLVKNGCATPAAESLTQELQVAIALSTVTPSNAPSNAVNSLTSNGQVFAETVAGITGNTKAVKIVTKTTTTYVMARCGNAVRPGIPPVPVKPSPMCSEVPIPVPPNGLCPKNPAKGPDENPSIPQQVRQTSPAPDNPSEVAQPPVAPTDSGTGIPPSATPRVTPSAAPTHISGPTASTTPTAPPVTPTPIQASPTASDPGGIGTHGP